MLTVKNPRRRRPLDASANNLYEGVQQRGPEGLSGEVRAQFAPGEEERQAGRAGLPRRHAGREDSARASTPRN